ncbi:MAG: cytochrome c [Pirellulaceae bacterium]
MIRRVSLQRRRAASPRPANAKSRTARIIFACALVAIGCDHEGDEQADSAYPSPIKALAIRGQDVDPQVRAQERGRTVFVHYCQICHGANGQGDGFNATSLAVPPRDFSDSEFWKQTTDDDLRTIVSGGGTPVHKSVLMPAWGKTLGKQQILDVIAYLRTVPEQVKRAEAAEAAEEAEETGDADEPDEESSATPVQDSS